MEIARITVQQNMLHITQHCRVTRGMVGCTVLFEKFSPEWDGLSRTAVFRSRSGEKDVVNVQAGAPVVIPWEVLDTALADLSVGICGTNLEGTQVIPTVWGSLGQIAPGVHSSGQPAEPPTPTWTQQIEGQVNKALEEVRSVRPLAMQVSNDAASAARSAKSAVDSCTAAHQYEESSRENTHDAIRGAQHAGQMATEATGAADAAKGSADTARLDAQKAVQAQSDAAVSAKFSAKSAAAAAESEKNVKADAERAKKEADRAASMIDDTAISSDKTQSSLELYRQFCPILDEAAPVLVCHPAAHWPIHVIGKVSVKQEGAGIPSPSNIRKIVSRSSAVLTHCGSNLIPSSICRNDVTHIGTVPSTQGGNRGILLKAGVTYILCASFQATVLYFNRFSDNTPLAEGHNSDEIRYTPAADTEVTLDVYRSAGIPAGGKCWLNVGGRQEYASECSLSYSADFPEPVYAGTLDWNRKELTIQKKTYAITGEEAWYSYSSPIKGVYYSPLLYEQNPVDDAVECDRFRYLGRCWESAEKNTFANHPTLENYYFNTTFHTVDAWKDYLRTQNTAGTPVTVTIWMREPKTLPVTISVVPVALSGVNILYTDCGDTHVTGRRDLISVLDEQQSQIALLQKNAIGGI